MNSLLSTIRPSGTINLFQRMINKVECSNSSTQQKATLKSASRCTGSVLQSLGYSGLAVARPARQQGNVDKTLFICQPEARHTNAFLEPMTFRYDKCKYFEDMWYTALHTDSSTILLVTGFKPPQTFAAAPKWSSRRNTARSSTPG